MRPSAVFLVVALALAGCASDDGNPPGTTTSPTTTAPHVPPRELVSETGGNAQCSEVLTAPATFEFDVGASYDEIEVSFHAVGVGRVGYAITGPNGTVADVPDHDVREPQDCARHQHGNGTRYAASPGAYAITVRNTGALSWELVIVERATESNASTHHA